VIEHRIAMITAATTLDRALGLDMHRQGIGTPSPRTLAGIGYLLEGLTSVRVHVKEHGRLKDEHHQWLQAHCNWKDGPIPVENTSPEMLKRQLLTALDKDLEVHQKLYELVGERERQNLAVRRERCALPPAAELDRLVRYESMRRRNFYRALEQLERLQRQRLGEYVPPPARLGLGP
jgi:hypothetical protein